MLPVFEPIALISITQSRIGHLILQTDVMASPSPVANHDNSPGAIKRECEANNRKGPKAIDHLELDRSSVQYDRSVRIVIETSEFDWHM